MIKVLSRRRGIIAILFLAIFIACVFYISTKKESVALETVYAIRLEIPSINIDAPIELVGITEDGAMGVPESPDTVGWYSLGPRPGEKGNAVIAGHRGWKNRETAVFDNLNMLQKGDTISVVNSDGSTNFFRVREKHVYDKDAFVPEVFISNDGAHLNLITCVGEWNSSLNTSNERLVVFADLI